MKTQPPVPKAEQSAWQKFSNLPDMLSMVSSSAPGGCSPLYLLLQFPEDPCKYSDTHLRAFLAEVGVLSSLLHFQNVLGATDYSKLEAVSSTDL